MTPRKRGQQRAAAPDDAGPRTARGRKTREKLLVAARAVFEEHGFLDAKIADIAERAGVAHGTFYVYFPSKEAIFHDLANSMEIDLLAVEAAPDDEHRTPLERIRAANAHYVDAYIANAKLLGIIEQVSTFDPEVRNRRLERQAEFGDRLEARIRHLQEQGQADPDIDPRYAAHALGCMVSDFAYYWLVEGQSFERDTAIDNLTRLWANAIGLREAAPRGRRSAKLAAASSG